MPPSSLPGLLLEAAPPRTLTAGAFTDALHVAYVVAGVAVLLVAAVAATLLGGSLVQAQQPPAVPQRLPIAAIPADAA